MDAGSFFGSQPDRVMLREQLTRHVDGFGGTPKTVDVMVMRGAVGPLPKFGWRLGNGGLAYCVEGALRLECVNEGGTRRILMLGGPEEFVPYPASPYRRGYRVRLSPHHSAVIAAWPPAALREIMLTIPESGMPSFLARTHLGWTPLRERWAILSMLEAPERIALVLDDLAARMGVPDGEGVRIAPPLFDRHIAALIGTARERANRCLNALIRGRLLRRLPDHRLWVHRDFLAGTVTIKRAGTT